MHSLRLRNTISIAQARNKSNGPLSADAPPNVQKNDLIERRAFCDWWIRDYPHKKADLEVIPFLELPVHEFGWIRTTREALFLSGKTVAQRMNMDYAAYLRLEQREQEGRVTLETLASVANAIDCDLVYAIRPKARTRFSVSIWKTLLPKALDKTPKRCAPQMKFSALARAAARIMKNPAHRRVHGWSKHINRFAFSLSPKPYDVIRSPRA